MKGWKDDKRWSDRYLVSIKRILGEHLIGEPPVAEDQERNTDLIVLRMDAVRIACRIRKSTYLGDYGHEFTIRCSRPSGIKTELSKIIEGWGDYFFYGFADESGDQLAAWVLSDLRVFRLWFMRELSRLDRGKFPGREKNNVDGSSAFRVFQWDDFPPEFIVATDGPRRRDAA